MTRVSLTQKVHQALSSRMYNGCIAIDATAGNGFDVLFLASQIGEKGQLFAFDIQQQAIETTRKRLDKADLSDRAVLFCAGHENMLELIPDAQRGKVDIIVFNLGYLPRTDKSVITQESSTLTALNSSLKLLSKIGYISVLAYPGHPGGREETEAVKMWARELPESLFDVHIHAPEHSGNSSPEWIEITVIRK